MEKKKKIETKKKKNTFILSFTPSDCLVQPINIRISFGDGETKKLKKGKK